MDRVIVGFGAEMLKIIPGVVSTEVHADLSFDEKGAAYNHSLYRTVIKAER